MQPTIDVFKKESFKESRQFASSGSEITRKWFSHWWKNKWLLLICLGCIAMYLSLANFRDSSLSKFDGKQRLRKMLQQIIIQDMPPMRKNSTLSTMTTESKSDLLESLNTSVTKALKMQLIYGKDAVIAPTVSSNSVPKTNSQSSSFFSIFSKSAPVTENTPLQRPLISQIMPHIKDETSLIPAYLSSKGRTGVEIVLGIPTVKRPKQNYLKVTLKRLLGTMSPADKNRTLIVILVAEVDKRYVTRVVTEIQTTFPEDVDSGLIDILSPPSSFYPDFASLSRATGIGDDLKRFTWRSKQNLDYAFLMMYSLSKGRYYMQLEDDILSRNNFVSTVLSAAARMTEINEEWIIADFCELGFIGKLFKSTDLAWMVEYFLIFFKDQPCDWLIIRAVLTKVCRLDETSERCTERKKRVWISHPESLFQHIGVISSLEGKIQKLKASHFGKLQLFIPHRNPAADVTTTISEVMADFHNADAAYHGRNFFWGKAPKVKDYVSFKFKTPIKLTRYLLRSGNLEHPSDQFYDTEVFVHPKNAATPILIGSFDAEGVASGKVPSELNPITELRLEVRQNNDNDVILSEVLLETEEN